MLESTASLYVLTGIFSLLVISAALFDVCKFLIPNYISVGLLLVFLAGAFILPYRTGWISHLGAAGAVFAAGLVLYRFRLLGAGDVKLITAVSAWAGFEHLPMFLLYTALAGGAMALGLLFLRYLILTIQIQVSHLGSVSMPRVLRCGESIPYGVAIAVGGLSQLYEFPHLLFYT